MWRLTGIYGESKSEEKNKTWLLLRIFKDRSNLLWVCCGVFNEILFNCEKEGGPSRADNYMLNFQQALEDCDLHDLGFVGDPFT